MKRSGTIVHFDTARGFGFLHSAQSPADVFFHVRDFNPHAGPPEVGLAVDFEEIHVGGKGPRAMAVRPAGAQAWAAPARRTDRARAHARPVARPPVRKAAATAGGLASGPTARLSLFILAAALEAGLLAWCLQQSRLPAVLLLLMLALNLATFWVYWHDKHLARQGAWRVSENTLHMLSLAGGWPAAWWAQQLLRHKSRKPAFRSAYAATVLGHLALLSTFIAWSWRA